MANLLTEMAFTLGVEELRSKTFDSTALPSFSHEKTTPYGALSMTSKSRTLQYYPIDQSVIVQKCQ